jgi:transposase
MTASGGRARIACCRNAPRTDASKSLLHAQGVREVVPLKPGFIASLERLRTGDGRPLPPRLKEEIAREHERLCLLDKQIRALEARIAAELRAAAPRSVEAKVVHLAQLKGIGIAGGQSWSMRCSIAHLPIAARSAPISG